MEEKLKLKEDLLNNCELFKNTEGEVVINTLQLAELTGQNHQSIMRNCRNWLVDSASEDGDFKSQSVMKEKYYINSQNKKQPYYELNKYQFMRYAMRLKGFQELKDKIIQDYEAMEKYILESNQSPEFEYFRKTGKILRKGLTDTIKNVMKPENKFVYSNFTNLVYLKVFGKKAKELKEERGLKKNDNLRDNLTPKELEEVAKIEKQVDSCITFFDMQGIDKSEYYSRIKELLGIK